MKLREDDIFQMVVLLEQYSFDYSSENGGNNIIEIESADKVSINADKVPISVGKMPINNLSEQ